MKHGSNATADVQRDAPDTTPTPVARELRLGDVGLEYREMDRFAVAVFADRQIAQDLLGSYGRVLADRLGSDLTRGPV